MVSTKIEPGTVVADRFEVEDQAGSGGMGVIYRATDRTTGAAVALKLLKTGSDGPSRERFAREAQVLSELRHPGIVSYIAHGQLSDGRSYLAMGWLSGEDLASRLHRGPLALSRCVALLRRLAGALAAAHRHGVVHRDLKPSNIFLVDGQVERAVLVDFGIARHTSEDQIVTGTGVIVGTPGYMAPEQARAESTIGPGADIFSLGCVLYQCLTGRPPFVAEHVAAVLAKILFEECPPPAELRPAPAELTALLHRMLRKDPEARPRDAIALQEEVSRISALPFEDDTPETLPQKTLFEPITPSALTDSEQVLVSVVMARARETPDAPGDAGPRDRAALNRALAGFGANAAWLADGSLVATLTRQGSNAVDLVSVAAQCALVVQERWPSARVALATGLGLLRDHLPAVGGAIDKAVELVHAPPPAPDPDSEVIARSGVWLDDASAGLLRGRFMQGQAGGRALLFSERVGVDESRLLLGKPTPCVGRELELAPIESLLSGSIEESVSCAVLVTAPAGMGKSRLRHELQRRLLGRYPAVTVLTGRGDPLRAGSPYGILGHALRHRFGLDSGGPPEEERARIMSSLSPLLGPAEVQRVAERLGELCGVPFSDEGRAPLRAARMDPRAMNDELHQAFVDWLKAECAAAPLLLVLEDLHWGDALTMKLLEVSSRKLSDMPFMMLALARPEVSEQFPKPWPWLTQEITLRPLSKKAGERLVREVLGPDVGPETLARIVEQAEGNALFLEELIRGVAEGQRGQAPETLLVMLQSRLSRLDPRARQILRAASIFGERFWSRGVRALAGACDDEIAEWLRLLVEAEIVVASPKSRFPGDVEHHFRHALLREAAYRLLTEEDRAFGHAAVSRYLEGAGESDPLVIAEHAQQGGDRARASRFYLSAASLSWERHDMDGVLAQVERCVACGASGEALGTARALECMAHVGKLSFARADVAATEAIALLRPGSLWWCRAIEKLFNILPQMGQAARLGELSRLFLTTEPDPAAISAYVVAASYPIGMLAQAGARPAAQAFLARIEQDALQRVIEQDPFARGWARFFHGLSVRVLSPDPLLAMKLARESERAFSEIGNVYGLTLATMLVGLSWVDLGDLLEGEKMLREGQALASQLSHGFLRHNTQMGMVLALAERSEPELLAEAHSLAQSIIEAGVSPLYVASGHAARAQVLLAWGRADEAEEAAREACATFTVAPPLLVMALTVQIAALLAQGRADAAALGAEDGLRILTSLGGAGYMEIPLRAAAVEAFHSAGDVPRALGALREALQQIDLRASKILDPAWRARYFAGRPENARVLSLARDWLADEGAAWTARLDGAS